MPESKKSKLELVIMPLALTVITTFATFFITKTQIDNNAQRSEESIQSTEDIVNAELKGAKELANAQIQSAKEMAHAEREIKIFEILFKQLSSGDVREQINAIEMFVVLSPELGGKMALAIGVDETQDPLVQATALKVVQGYQISDLKLCEQSAAQSCDKKLAAVETVKAIRSDLISNSIQLRIDRNLVAPPATVNPNKGGAALNLNQMAIPIVQFEEKPNNIEVISPEILKIFQPQVLQLQQSN